MRADTVTITIGEVKFTHTVQVGQDAKAVAEALVALIKDVGVTAAATETGLTLTADVAGTEFTATGSVEQVVATNGAVTDKVEVGNIPENQAQVSTITFDGANTIEPGDTFSVTIAGEPDQVISYTTLGDETWGDILNILADEFDADQFDAEVVVANDGLSVTDYSLVLTAKTAGTGFEVTAKATNREAGVDNTAAEVVVTDKNVEEVTAKQQVSTIDLGADKLDAGDVVQ